MLCFLVQRYYEGTNCMFVKRKYFIDKEALLNLI